LCPTFLVTTFVLLGRTIESCLPSLCEAMPFHYFLWSLWRTDRTNLTMAIFKKRKEKQLKVGRRVPTSCKTKTIVEPTDETPLLSIQKPSKHPAGKKRRKFWFSKKKSKNPKHPIDETSLSWSLHTTVLIQEQPKQQDESITSADSTFFVDDMSYSLPSTDSMLIAQRQSTADLLSLHTTIIIQEQPKQQDESITSADSTFLVDDMSYSLPSTDSMFTEQRQSTAVLSRMFCGVERCAGIQFVEDIREHPSSVSSSSSSEEKSTATETIREAATQAMRIMKIVKKEMDAFPARVVCGADAQDDDISLSLASFANSEITGFTSTDLVKLPASMRNMFGIFSDPNLQNGSSNSGSTAFTTSTNIMVVQSSAVSYVTTSDDTALSNTMKPCDSKPVKRSASTDLHQDEPTTFSGSTNFASNKRQKTARRKNSKHDQDQDTLSKLISDLFLL
jgi:hypothetical protein